MQCETELSPLARRSARAARASRAARARAPGGRPTLGPHAERERESRPPCSSRGGVDAAAAAPPRRGCADDGDAVEGDRLIPLTPTRGSKALSRPSKPHPTRRRAPTAQPRDAPLRDGCACARRARRRHWPQSHDWRAAAARGAAAAGHIPRHRARAPRSHLAGAQEHPQGAARVKAAVRDGGWRAGRPTRRRPTATRTPPAAERSLAFARVHP